jgi:hypothetical protein
VLQTIEHGQGLVVDAGEVAATSKLYGEGYGVGLNHLGLAFAKVPTFKDVPLASLQLEVIRSAAKSDHPAVRFWGRFIVELGRNSPGAHDLLGQVNPAEVRLDAVQVFLLLSRLAGDLALLDRPAKANNGFPPGAVGARHQTVAYSHHARLQTQVVRGRTNESRFIPVRFTVPIQQPCGTTDGQGVVLDYGALASTTLNGELLERLGHTGKGIPIANVVLAVLKFILTYAMLETEIILAGTSLVRTKDTKPGEMRVLLARVWIENKAEAINCVRPFLNMIGLDFNLPQSGPLAGVNVVWEGVLGFDEDSRGSLSSAQEFIRNLGKEPPRGKPILYFGSLFSPVRSRTQPTNQHGLSSISVTGSPQEKDLSREKLTQINEVAGVMIRVQIKSTKINDVPSALGTIGDFAGPVIALLTGDVAGAAVGLATEILYRMSWRGSEPFYFVVRDWEPCTGQWTGTITVTEGYKYTDSFKDSHRWAKTTRTETYSATLTVGERTDSQSGQINLYNATVKTEGGYTETEDSSGLIDCYKVIHRSSELSGHSETQDGVTVIVNPDLTYRVNYSLPSLSTNGLYNVSSHLEGPACHNPFANKDGSSSRPRSRLLIALRPDIEGVLDPNNPGVLTGTKTVSQDESGGKRTATVKWNLARCGSR